MSLISKFKKKAGVSAKHIIKDIKDDMKFRHEMNRNIKAKQKAAFYKEKERLAVKKAKASARGGGILNKLMAGPKVGKKKGAGFSMDINMGGFEPKKGKKKDSWI